MFCHIPLDCKNNLYIFVTSLIVPCKSDLILHCLSRLRIDAFDPFIATEPAIRMTADSDLDRIKYLSRDSDMVVVAFSAFKRQ